MWNLDFIELTYLLGAFHGLVLILLLSSKKEFVKPNLALVIIVAMLSYYLITRVMYLSGFLYQAPHFYYTGAPLTLLIPAFFYQFVYFNAYERYDKRLLTLILALLPFVFEVALQLPFYTSSAEAKIQVYEWSLRANEEGSRVSGLNLRMLVLLLYLGISFYFLSRSVKILSVIREAIPNKSSYTQLVLLSKAFIAYLLADSGISIAIWIEPNFQHGLLHWLMVFQVIVIHTFGYVVFRLSNVNEVPHGIEPPLDEPSLMLKDLRGSLNRIKMPDIVLIKSDDHYQKVYTKQGLFYIRDTISRFQQKLVGEDFRRVHRSAIVNLSEIDRFTPSGNGEFHLKMSNGEEVKVSRSYKDEIRSYLQTLD